MLNIDIAKLTWTMTLIHPQKRLRLTPGSQTDCEFSGACKGADDVSEQQKGFASLIGLYLDALFRYMSFVLQLNWVLDKT